MSTRSTELRSPESVYALAYAAVSSPDTTRRSSGPPTSKLPSTRGPDGVRSHVRISPVPAATTRAPSGEKLTCDGEPDVPASRFHVRGIPTLVVLKNGQLVDTIVGAVPREDIVSAIERHLG